MTGHVSISEGQAVELKLDAEAANVMLVRQAVEGAVRELGATGRVIEDVKLAVTEACSNVVKYAYGGESGPMSVGVADGDGKLRITISDQGSWREHDPSGGIEASGMGIPLMEAVTESCDIDTDADGTTVRLVFGLSGEEPGDGD